MFSNFIRLRYKIWNLFKLPLVTLQNRKCLQLRLLTLQNRKPFQTSFRYVSKWVPQIWAHRGWTVSLMNVTTKRWPSKKPEHVYNCNLLIPIHRSVGLLCSHQSTSQPNWKYLMKQLKLSVTKRAFCVWECWSYLLQWFSKWAKTKPIWV